MSMFNLNINITGLRSYKDAKSVMDMLDERHTDLVPEMMSVSELALLMESIDEITRALKDLREDLDTLYASAFRAEESIGETMTDLTKEDEGQHNCWF